MARILMLVGVVALLSGCDSYYGGAPGYAVNERLTLNQLAGSQFDQDLYWNGAPGPTAMVREAKAGTTF